MKRINRINETKINKYGSIIKIIDYVNCDNILVEFDNGHIINAQYNQFKNGTLTSPYDKTISNVGYVGDFNNIDQKIYGIWAKMIRRCYDLKTQEKHPTYIGCTVCNEWHNYQNFARWYNENYYKINDEQMEIDKDILLKGNKIYSPEFCIIVPSSINCLFIKSDVARGNYFIGTYYKKDIDKFVAQCNNTIDNKRKNVFLGYHDLEIEAFNAYKKYKEKLIKEVAEKFKNQIPQKLYLAMYNYVVEIDD